MGRNIGGELCVGRIVRHPHQRVEPLTYVKNAAHSPQLFLDPECFFGRESSPRPTAAKSGTSELRSVGG